MSDQGHESVIIYDGRVSVTIPYSVIRFLHSQSPVAEVELADEELEETYKWLDGQANRVYWIAYARKLEMTQ